MTTGKYQLGAIALRLGVLATVAGAALFTMPSIARAQDAGAPTQTINLQLNMAPVRSALAILFQGQNLNYTMDPSVTGLVTVSLKGVSFETALHAVLRSVVPPLVADKDGDVYYIKPKAAETPGSGGGPGGGGPGGVAPPNAGGFPGVSTSPVPAPEPAPVAQPTAGAGTGIQLSNFEVIQLRYADARLLLSLLGQPSLVVPATSMETSGGGGGGGGGGFGGGGGGGSFGGSSGGSTSFGGGSGGSTSFGGGGGSSYGGGGGGGSFGGGSFGGR